MARSTISKRSSYLGMTECDVSPLCFHSEGLYTAASGIQLLRETLRSLGASRLDGLKFSGGCISLLPTESLRPYVDAAHEYGLYVSSGGWAEHLLQEGRPSSIESFVKVCKEAGFDVVELSTALMASEEHLLRLIRAVRRAGMAARPEIGLDQADTGRGRTTNFDRQVPFEGLGPDPAAMVRLAERCLQAGADAVLIPSEGIAEPGAATWRTDVAVHLVERLGLERTVFEVSHPDFAEWLLRAFGPEVNLSIDHTHLLLVRRLRFQSQSAREPATNHDDLRGMRRRQNG